MRTIQPSYSTIRFTSIESDLASSLASVSVEDSLPDIVLKLRLAEFVRVWDFVEIVNQLMDGFVERHRFLDPAAARVVPLEALEVVLELLDGLHAVLADRDTDPAVGINHTDGTGAPANRSIDGHRRAA